MAMKCFIAALVCFLVLQQPTQADDFINKLVKIFTGVETFVSTTFFTNCQDLKSIFGITYDQFVANNRTPNLTRVEVNLQVGNTTYSYNLLSAAASLLANPNFDKTKPVAIYIHGFLANENSSNVVEMVKSLVRRGGYNVVFLDSSALIYFFYMFATTCVEFIGLELGRQLAKLTNGGVNPKNIHMMGFSLGAHIAGFAGQSFKNATGNTIGRISAFDAAGPCYYNVDADLRLSPDDADFVDAVHTDAGVMGIIRTVGHVDFYVNGGSSQPYCLILFESHLRSWQYYNETLLSGNERDFIAVKCDSWYAFRRKQCTSNARNYLGIGVLKNVTGKFFLRTADTTVYPFGLKEDGTYPKSDPVWEFLAWFFGLFGIIIPA